MILKPKPGFHKISLFILFFVLLMTGCSKQQEEERLHVLTYESKILGKEMITHVYLPEDYDEDSAYPVLYFFSGGGGSSYMVINQFGICQAYDRLIESGGIHPMIIAAPGIDLSFAMNTAAETGEVETENNLVFAQGRYEDYFLEEVIPMIEDHFAASSNREDRFIGGYSMGGLAALHVSMRNPDLFSRAGGHSPTLFLEDEIDLANETFLMVRNYFYPTPELGQLRNPIQLAESADLTEVSFYLDTGPADVNARAILALGEELKERDIDVRVYLHPGEHGYAYCNFYMEDYLLFYAGIEN